MTRINYLNWLVSAVSFTLVSMQVDTIRFTDSNAPKLFTQSLKETGFAVLKDHPIPVGLIENTYSEWQRFFASEEKQKHLFDTHTQFGYFPFRTENAKGSSVKDLKEFFHYYPWGQLPESVNRFTPQIFQALCKMGRTLLQWIDETSPSEVRKLYSMPLKEMPQNDERNLLRVLHYPPLDHADSSAQPGAVRAAAHEDINLITLLVAGTQPGLQAKDTKGHWHNVQCDPGTIVVNCGDMLNLASGGFYPSTTHRVVNPSGDEMKKSRFSMPLFVHPAPWVRLSEKYTSDQYLNERLREIGLKS